METKKIFNKKNILNGLFIALLLVLVFVPAAKALMIQGLMEVGLFNPDTTDEKNRVPGSVDLSAIKFKDTSGKITDLASLKGKTVFVNFWATWCPPCLAEMPSINKLYEQFKQDKDVVFILVDADGDFSKSQKYMDRKGFKLPVYSVAGNIPDLIFSGSLPTTVVFDKFGRVSYNESGAANYASKKFIDFINQLKALSN